MKKERRESAPVIPVETAHKQEHETAVFSAELGTPPQVDLHAMNAREAAYAIEAFLHEQFMSGEHVVKIIHGRGTGRLRDAVHQLLKDHALVEYYRDAQSTAMMGGVTYAVLGKKD